jgi:hypothetical protein
LIGFALRPYRCVPKAALALLALALLMQLTWAALQPRPVARATELPQPPAGPAMVMLQHFEPLPSAHLMALYLQAFDNQPGISIPFRELDYERVASWLHAILELDPAGQYPLMMATQLYAQVPDAQRQRTMLAFAYEHFLADPDRRWRWLAHAAIMAKHRLNDLPLALKYARAISEKSGEAPAWARQMHIFVLEDMGELEAARILLGGLLASGSITDDHERLLLLESLERIRSAENSAGVTKR